MTREQLQAAVAHRKAQMDAVSAMIEEIRGKVAPIVAMWDGLSGTGKGVIERLLPTLGAAIDSLRELINKKE